MCKITGRLEIVSDFEDYYDSYVNSHNKDASVGESVVYDRTRLKLNKCQELAELKKLGIPVIDIVPVSNLLCKEDELLVVYTDIKKHNGNGKVVVAYNEANMLYSNRLCSRLSNQYNGHTYKYVQIGKRRFWLIIKNDGLKESSVVSIQELESAYTNLLGLPIFSIDYTFINGVQTAVDLNTVQNLKKLRLQEVIASAEVCEEIYSSLVLRQK